MKVSVECWFTLAHRDYAISTKSDLIEVMILLLLS
jgi:hypothetical protein